MKRSGAGSPRASSQRPREREREGACAAFRGARALECLARVVERIEGAELGPALITGEVGGAVELDETGEFA